MVLLSLRRTLVAISILLALALGVLVAGLHEREASANRGVPSAGDDREVRRVQLEDPTATPTPTTTSAPSPTFTPSPTHTGLALDSDGDQLVDVHETDTGVFNTVIDTGTDPMLPDTDGDGCGDGTEVFEMPTDGGARNPVYPWDFFDVTGDRLVDFDDTLLVLSFFGTSPSDPAWDERFDRYIPNMAEPWRTALSDPADGIDLTDALANLGSFGHQCVPPNWSVSGIVCELPSPSCGALRGATVELSPEGITTTTSIMDGSFEFVAVPPGSHDILIVSPACTPFGCYEPTEIFVSGPVNLLIHPIPLPPP